MSAKILKFTPKKDNILYFKPKAQNSNPVNKINYLDSLKIEKTYFTKKELSVLAQHNCHFDEKYLACYLEAEYADCELIEKRGDNFFYLEFLPFNIYPSNYKHFESFQDLIKYIQELN